MKTHYRRISKTALGKVASLGDISAVKVGKETNGWAILEVVGKDRDGLPGSLISESFGGLKGAARSAVHRSRIRKTILDEEDNPVEVTETIPANKVPGTCAALPEHGPQMAEGDAVLQEGINPHRFI